MTLIALLVFLGFLGLILALTFLVRRRGARSIPLREVEALQNLPNIVGEAVESGRRMHLSLGSGGIGQADTITVLAGLSTATPIAAVTAISDKPPVITTADAVTMLLAQDTLRQVYREQNAQERYSEEAARVAGLTPLSFGAALTPLVKDEAVAGNVLIGPVGTEAVLLTEAAQRAGVATLAGTSDLTAQAALFAAADQPLIGEDVYAGNAYLTRGEAQVASLQAQDVVRLVLIAGMILGVLAKTFGLM